MRVGIITFHFVNNFGGVLQAYALQRFVKERCEVEVEIIDYRNWFIRLTDRIRLLPITSNPKEIFSGLRTMGARIGRRNKFGKFSIRYSHLSRKYMSGYGLRKCPPGDDKYICGSDQIWNPILTAGVSYGYYLQFENNPHNKIAYAPSFGTASVNKCFKKKMIKYLKSIKYLSIREESGQELIRRFTGRDCPRLIDPTFLLSKQEWNQICWKERIYHKPYILLYIMQRDSEVYNYAKELKEKTGLRIVEISRYGYNPGFIDETLVNVGPIDFLTLFRDAEYICTNSYHGLAYSVIFEKKFFLIPCKRFRTRINNLLNLIGIENVNQKWDNIQPKYDKEIVNEIICEQRKQAEFFLKSSIWGDAENERA